MKMLQRAAMVLLALLCMPAAALAQSASSAAAPAGFAPIQAPCVVQANGTCAAVDATHPLPVGGTTLINGATFTTPSGTSAYSSGQLIANSATAGSVTPLSFTACRIAGGSGMLRRMRLKTPDTGFAGVTVTVKLYKDSPTLTNGDHATWLTTESNYLGSVSITLDQHFSDAEKGIGVPGAGSEINYECASGSTVIYGLVVAGGAITPQGAKLFTAVGEFLVN